MTKDSAILTVDIGSESLKIAEFAVAESGALTLTKFACRKLEAPEVTENDVGIGMNDLNSVTFRRIFNEIVAENQFTAKRARISLPASSAFLRLSKLPDALGNREAINRIVEYEAQQAVPCALSEVEWDYQLIHHVWSESVEEPNAEGVLESSQIDREEYEALFVAIKREQITEYTTAIEDAGFQIVSVSISPIELFNAAKATQLTDENQCAVLLNIGSRNSSLVISDHNRVFLRSIPIGGNAISAQIAREYDVTLKEAEELKRRHGFVAFGSACEDPDSEMAATISKISRNVMTRIHGEFSRSINVWRAQHGGTQPTLLLLSGGSSVMPGVNEFFQEKLRLNVDYLNTFGAINIDDAVDKNKLQDVAPGFQELIGLALHEVIDSPVEISLLPREIRNQMRLNRQKPYFIASAAALLVGLMLFAFGMQKQALIGQDRVTQTEEKLDAAKKVGRQIKNELNRTNREKNNFVEMENLLLERSAWCDMLRSIQQITPDLMWITSIEGIADPNVKQDTDTKKGASHQNGMSVEQVLAQTEIRAIRISGYTLIFQGRRAYSDFRKGLMACSWVEEVRDVDNSDMSTVGGNNTGAFSCIVVLKQPIKK